MLPPKHTPDTIFVTQPLLPTVEKFTKYLEQIWENKWLTNNGTFHQTFEQKLSQYLGVTHCNLLSNGTLALMIGLRALNITGEVITTPFSFVATTHVLHWSGIEPVFCDIKRSDFTIDESRIESLITPRTTAIMPVHVYGFPCNFEALKDIADTYGLRIIYDAAHAFGVKEKGHTILNNGDLSILSFHATKVFNTIEGGAVISNDVKIKERIDRLKNFGFDGTGRSRVVLPGINAKMNEIQAAYGLLQLEMIDIEISKRKKIAELYSSAFSSVEGITTFGPSPETESNYGYFPILIDKASYGLSRDQLYELYLSNNIYTRKYFHPLISHLSTYQNLPTAAPKNLPVSEVIANEILCLPIYGNLESSDVEKVINIIVKARKC